MRDIARRALGSHPQLTAELWRRGAFDAAEKAEILRRRSFEKSHLGPVQFATLLAQSDTHLAARAVLRGLLDAEELRWLDRLLKFRKADDK